MHFKLILAFVEDTETKSVMAAASEAGPPPTNKTSHSSVSRSSGVES